MPSQKKKIDLAQVFADAFVSNFGIDSGLRLEQVAEQLGLVIVDVDADGFEGVLRRIKGRMIGTVGLSGSVRDSGRRKFTLAHEIGHYLLPGHDEVGAPCRSSDIEAWDKNLATREIEANRFAASALMPSSTIIDLVREEPEFRNIERIAERSQTSLTASAYRYVELSDFRIAIVWSADSQIRWIKKSENFFRFIKAGKLADLSFAARLALNDRPHDAFDRLDADVWLDPEGLKADATILEHSKQLGRYGILTLLWIDEPIESWHRY